MRFDDPTKLKEIERELMMRKRYYPLMIARGQLNYEAAQKQMQIMQAIAEDYRALIELPLGKHNDESP